MTEEQHKLILSLKEEVEKIKITIILENKKLDEITSVLNFLIQKEKSNA
jgi:hypothetical protein